MSDSKLLYEGKAKRIFAADEANQVIQYFKDDATAFNGERHDILNEKGVLNNYISAFIMEAMSKNSVKNHFIKRLDNRNQLVEKVDIIPLEVIVRNIAAGSLCKRLGVTEGEKFDEPLVEFCYKRDDLGDPLITDDHVKMLKIADESEIKYLKEQALKVNKVLQEIFDGINITLVDFKIEFGKNNEGQLILADEISPDSCRLWDKDTNEKMDKDRFRLDLGDLVGYYKLIAERLNIKISNA